MSKDEFILKLLEKIREYRESCNQLEKVGFDLDGLQRKIDNLEDLALDYIGIPPDTTCEYEAEYGFCRDYWYDLISDMELNSKSIKRLMEEAKKCTEDMSKIIEKA
jgi:uncharacterized coiled-coil DUF342 family protein